MSQICLVYIFFDKEYVKEMMSDKIVLQTTNKNTR